MRNRIVCAMALVGLVFSLAVSARQDPQNQVALERLVQAEQQRLESLAAIAADRPGFVRDIVTSWNDHAAQAGFTPDWWNELELALTALPAERLAQARNAQSYEALVATIFGSKSASTLSATIDTRQIGSENLDLVYTPITPCRIADTRYATAGPLVGGTTRAFHHHNSVSGTEIASQGGNAGGCPIPTDPAALAINFTALSAQRTGWLTSWAYLGTQPASGSVLNYEPAVAIGNTAIVPMCQICGADFNVLASFNVQAPPAVTHVVIDVLGYFWSPVSTPLDVVNVTNATSVGAGGTWDIIALCPSGRTLLGGGVDIPGLPTNVWVTQNAANPSGNAWQTRGINNAAGTITVTVQARCGMVPGR